MPFSDKIRREAKRAAHFKCCWCQQLRGSLDAHHIKPEAEGGLNINTFDNAAPLCKECHDTYGSNPNKRAEVRQRRDFWYKFCEERLYSEDVNGLEKLHEKLRKVEEGYNKRIEVVEEELKGIQTELERLVAQNSRIISEFGSLSANRKQDAIAQFASTSNTITYASATMKKISEGVYSNARCPKCGTFIGLSISNWPGTPKCPNCGSLMK